MTTLHRRPGSPAWRKPLVAGIVAAVAALNGPSSAAEVQVNVDGGAGPWDPNSNFVKYPYGVFVNGEFDVPRPATALGKSNGIPMKPGRQLIVTYVSGMAGANANIFGDRGDGVRWWPPYTLPCTNAPGCYTHEVTYLEQLIGAFTDSAGVLVADPVVLGSGPTKVVVPPNAKLLLMGFNDDWHNDNTGSIVVDVKTDCTPDADTTTFSQWNDDFGFPTLAEFKVSLLPSNADFSGFEVREVDAAPAVDTCYRPGDKKQGVKPVRGVTGTKWGLDSSTYSDDIGWSQDYVEYYRANHRTPCGFQSFQQMQVRCSKKEAWRNYGPVHVLTGIIEDEYLQNSRDDVFTDRHKWP